MVSITQTARKYHGRKAATYDEIRTKQQRWTLENDAVDKLLRKLKPVSSVLDVPVGTGRFLPLYEVLSVATVFGVDVSEEMLALARQKVTRRMRQNATVELALGDATKLDASDATVDVVVCVRFLDLIDEEAMRKVVTELCRVARRGVILTIRLGDAYVPKTNTAEHDRAAFNRLVKKLGWRVEESIPIFDAGWTVMRLGRK